MYETRSILFVATAVTHFTDFLLVLLFQNYMQRHKQCQNRINLKGILGLTVYYVTVRYSSFKTASM